MATTEKKNKYISTVGRRKVAVARVRLSEDSKNKIVVNDRPLEEYFPTEELQNIAKDALLKSKAASKFSVSARTTGGGVHAQAEALRHGIARALIDFDEELRGKLKKSGFLKRDPRVKERKKFGLKKARRAPQWSKR